MNLYTDDIFKESKSSLPWAIVKIINIGKCRIFLIIAFMFKWISKFPHFQYKESVENILGGKKNWLDVGNNIHHQ